MNEEGKYLVINNISKKNNIKSLCTVAAAFGFCVLFSNPRLFDDSTLQPLIERGLKSIRFPSISAVKQFLVERSVPLVGIEIMDSAIPCQSFPYESSAFRVAFIPGNEGTGLNLKQKELCDMFIYIPQFGTGTASLNVAVATSIILNEYRNHAQASSAK